MSAWSEFTDSVVKIGQAGYDAYNDYTSRGGGIIPPPATPAPAPVTTAAKTSPSWVLPAAIGAVVLVVVLVVFNRK